MNFLFKNLFNFDADFLNLFLDCLNDGILGAFHFFFFFTKSFPLNSDFNKLLLSIYKNIQSDLFEMS